MCYRLANGRTEPGGAVHQGDGRGGRRGGAAAWREPRDRLVADMGLPRLVRGAHGGLWYNTCKPVEGTVQMKHKEEDEDSRLA